MMPYDVNVMEAGQRVNLSLRIINTAFSNNYIMNFYLFDDGHPRYDYNI